MAICHAIFSLTSRGLKIECIDDITNHITRKKNNVSCACSERKVRKLNWEIKLLHGKSALTCPETFPASFPFDSSTFISFSSLYSLFFLLLLAAFCLGAVLSHLYHLSVRTKRRRQNKAKKRHAAIFPRHVRFRRIVTKTGVNSKETCDKIIFLITLRTVSNCTNL